MQTDRRQDVVGIFQPNFLSVSMTFIYRQLLGVSEEFRPIVLATRLNNQHLFPYRDVFVKRAGALERVYAKVLRTTGRFAGMSRIRRRFWRAVLEAQEVRLVHAHFGQSGVEILPVARELRLPLLVTFHGADASSWLRNRGYVEKLRELFDYAHIIAVSQDMADRLVALGADPARTWAHYIGVPVEDFQFVRRKSLAAKSKDGETVVLLQVSNFIEKKGHLYTLQAFRAFQQHYPRCKLVLAGGGILREAIERAAHELEIANKVEFVGVVAKPRVIELMSNADMFLHHSVTAANGNTEGIPTVLMEAMATGLPVVSTFHSGIPELIKDGESGFLVQERDVAAYSQKLILALSQADGMAEKAAATVAATFNLSRQNESLKSIYRRIIDGRQGFL